MFEVGKTYRNKTSAFKYTCLCVGGKKSFFDTLDSLSESQVIISNAAFDNFVEYTEPKREVRYFNVYRDGVISLPHRTRDAADKACLHGYGVNNRIACQRVEFVEGTFHE